MTNRVHLGNPARGDRPIRALSLPILVVVSFLNGLSSMVFGQAVSLNPNSGSGGLSPIATSTGFTIVAPGFDTGFYVNGNLTAACPLYDAGNNLLGPDAIANCQVPVTMPAGPPGSVVPVTAGNSLLQSASTQFTILSPQFTISPTCGLGATITATGASWSVSSGIGYKIDSVDFGILGYTNQSGNFTQTISVPVAPGTHVVEVYNAYSDLQQTFTVGCPQVGTMLSVTGTVQVTHADGTTGVLGYGDPVYEFDTIETAAGGEATIQLGDNTTLVLGENSKHRVDQFSFNSNDNSGSIVSTWLQGTFQWVGQHLNKQEDVRTDHGNIGIRGTEFIASYGATNAEIDLLSGVVAVSPNQTIVTTEFTGPITIVFDDHGTTTASLTQDQYNTIKASLFPLSDTTPPQVTVTFPTPPGGQAGFFKGGQTPVSGGVSAADPSSVSAITCSDSLNGLTAGALTGGGTVVASKTLSVTGDGSHSISCTAGDGANNTGAAAGSTNTATVMIDSSPPAIVVTTPASGGSYGQGSAVTASYGCSDALSGIANCVGTVANGAAIPTSRLGAQSFIVTATDQAGNATQATVSYMVTAAGPVITPVMTGTIGLNGWFTSDVGLTWTVVSTIPITSKTGCQARTVSSNAKGVAFTCTAQNATARSSQSVTIRLDDTPPSVTASAKPEANGNGWQRAATTVSFSCSDGTSGILTCPTPITLVNEGTAQSASGTGVNNAGLQTTTTASGIKIDLTAPTVTINVPANGAVYTKGSAVSASYACSDTLSGVATCHGTVGNGDSINTATRGTKSFTVTGTDLAGNTTKISYAYTVH